MDPTSFDGDRNTARSQIDLLVSGGTLITVDDDRRIIDAAIAVVDGRIAGIGDRGALIRRLGEPREQLNARSRYIIPGLVNAHTHLFQSALRGLGDGLGLAQWLTQVALPFYANLDAEDAHWFSLLGALENIRGGVTTVVNFQAFPNDLEACRLTTQAVGIAGLRALVVKSCYGTAVDDKLVAHRGEAMTELRMAFQELDRSYDGRVRICAGFPRPVSVPASWIQELYSIASEHGSGLHTHVAETRGQVDEAVALLGVSEIEYLSSLGVIDHRFQGAHAIHLTSNDLTILMEARANLVHCPVSNMYMGSGIADVPEMIDRGINVALGSDGSATNNNQDMFVVMRLSALLQRAHRQEPSLIAPGTALECATRNGAAAASCDAGFLAEGKAADFTVVDLEGMHNQPLHRPVSALINSAHSDDVDSVVVDGRVVLRDREFISLDSERVITEAKRRAQQIGLRAHLLHSSTWPWI